MKGSIRERSGSYQIRISLGKSNITGKYDSYTETVDVSGLNRKDAKDKAEKRLREVLTEKDKGIFIKPGKANVTEYLRAWLNDYVKMNLSGRTYELYKYLTEYHIIPAIGICRLVDLKPQHVQHLYSEKKKSGLSARTVQLIHVCLHKALKNAVRIGLIQRNPAEIVDKPKDKRREMRTLSESDLHLFLDRARDTEYFSLFYVLLFTGLRRGEALALRWSDADLLLCQLSVTRSLEHLRGEDNNQLTFKEPKTTSSRRMIALSPSTVAVLNEHREKQKQIRKSLDLPELKDNDLIFSHYDGSPLLPDSVTQVWRRVARRCGLSGVRLHDARHTHASLLLKQGVSPKIISERLGHANITTTLNIYAHTTAGMQAAAASQFDNIVMAKK